LSQPERFGCPVRCHWRFRDYSRRLARATADVDLLIDTSLENEALVYRALEILPDKAVRELKPGEVSRCGVVRVGDEIMVDLMKSAFGIEYAEAANEIVIREVPGGGNPFRIPAVTLAHQET
jgi:hypothetical protein